MESLYIAYRIKPYPQSTEAPYLIAGTARDLSSLKLNIEVNLLVREL